MVRVVHTLIWAFFVAVIVAMPVAAWQRRWDALPIFVARHNKEIFGSLFLAGLLFGAVRYFQG